MEQTVTFVLKPLPEQDRQAFRGEDYLRANRTVMIEVAGGRLSRRI